MKISAFQIRNYRSIIDSGKCFLSPDYITALIGQNESGKTSVLEALRSFYEGYITDDVLRSDLTFPEITCTFLLDENKQLGDYLNVSGLPSELHETVVALKEVSVTRKWLNSRKSIIALAEPEIVNFYQQLETEKNKTGQKIIQSIFELVKQAEMASRELEASENAVTIARNELNSIHARTEELKRTIGKARHPDVKITAEQELGVADLQLVECEVILKDKLTLHEDRKNQMHALAEKLAVCRSFQDASNKVDALTADVQEKSAQLHEIEHDYEQCHTSREIRLVSKRLEQIREIHTALLNRLKEQQSILSVKHKVAHKMLSGLKSREAEQEAMYEHDLEKSYATIEEMGIELFKMIPMFEFFEDFSSLLPNKIDLEDLLNENIHAEGYKAARNFLCVAGLNADFFREKNHRILKQKIENLNSEITIDFQDYWRQSVGKDDKIRIHFELEHYDNSQPDKSGKPYLEFWIKDKQERLYPKQRSRGVRWFLSFYLELKATAKANPVDRVMLIDEPGLSLHARAQEDVLKVFEDLRENLQIIYCTHSPNLIDLKKLYRIIAVQREKETDEKSETIILDARSLNEASTDTLSPIYALMGTRLNDRQFIFPKNNFIVEDAVTFHYLDTLAKVFGIEESVHFIPASGSDSIALMANMMFGWKIDFSILIMDNPTNRKVMEFLKDTILYPYTNNETANKITCFEGFPSIEDMFSTIDFKRFILQQRVGITVQHSAYIETNKLSRIILASDFCSKVRKEAITVKDFDEETRNNFERLFSAVKKAAE